MGELARTPRIQGGGSSKVVPTRTDDLLSAPTELLDADRVRFAAGYRLTNGGPDAEAWRHEAVEIAAACDVAIVCVGLPEAAESEGADRTHLDLPADQVALIEAVAAVCDRVVVLVSAGSVVALEPWQRRVSALMDCRLLGQAGGRALAELLLGRAAPSGRLAESIPLRLEDTPCYAQFPGGHGTVSYGEGCFVGYRHYDTVGAEVAYPFGHGLTYISFTYSDLEVSLDEVTGDVDVAAVVSNIGERDGAEVVPIYGSDRAATLPRPEHELRAFAKVPLTPGESRRVAFTLGRRSLSFWSPRDRAWRLEAGELEIGVAASSRDVRLLGRLTHPGDGVRPALTAVSTMAEWLAHPVGAPALAAALEQISSDERTTMTSPEVLAMIGWIPLQKMVTFGASLTHADVVELVRKVSEPL